jgi:hypothetical protein
MTTGDRAEMPDEKFDRLRAMFEDEGETWDFSPKDRAAIRWAFDEIRRLRGEIADRMTGLNDLRRLAFVRNERLAFVRNEEDICQVLGSALGYPRYADDPAAFPGATEADGVCVGERVAASLAMEAADRIRALEAENEQLREQVDRERAMGDWLAKDMGEAP